MKPGRVTDDKIYLLATRIGKNWKKLARKLRFYEPEIEGYDLLRRCERLDEKAYEMLMDWKERMGRGATYEVLHEAFNGRDCKEERNNDLHNVLECCQQYAF